MVVIFFVYSGVEVNDLSSKKVYFELSAFTEVETMRGDRLHLVQNKVITPADSRYGAGEVSDLVKESVPGYTINNRNSVGLELAGGSQRYHASYVAYLNIYAGFDPSSVDNNTYLLVNGEGLYEMAYIESVRQQGIPFYAVYELSETDNSKKLYDENKSTLIDQQ